MTPTSTDDAADRRRAWLCRDAARIDNGLGIDNAEHGAAVSVCTGLRAPWAAMWPSLRTIS